MKNVMFMIGSLFVTGNLCAMVPQTAAAKPAERSYSKELEDAAKAGQARAQYELALCYISANGVSRSVEQAKIWYEKAAKQGHADAQYNLARIFVGRKILSSSCGMVFKSCKPKSYSCTM